MREILNLIASKTVLEINEFIKMMEEQFNGNATDALVALATMGVTTIKMPEYSPVYKILINNQGIIMVTRKSYFRDYGITEMKKKISNEFFFSYQQLRDGYAQHWAFTSNPCNRVEQYIEGLSLIELKIN